MFSLGWSRKIIPLTLIALVISFFGLTTLRAQDESPGNGMRITPIRKEFILTASQSDSYEIEVTNVSTGDMNIAIVVNDFESDNATGQPKLLVGPGESSTHSLKSFVKVPSSISLKPGETKKVTVDVTVPDNAAPGGYFGVVRFQAGGRGATANAGDVALNASVSSILLVSVPGQTNELLNLSSIQVLKNNEAGTFFETAPESVAIRLENAGNTIVKPFGRVTIKDWRSNEVYSYEFNGSLIRGNVLPESSRVFEDPISNIGRIGRYTVEANLSYGDGGGNILYGSTTFWVVPWRLLLGIMVLLIALIWVATRGIKLYNKRIIAKAKRQ